MTMILARFFRPRWQHSNPQTRRQALLRLSSRNPEEHAILQKLATEDAEVEVRKAAVKHVSDLAFLRHCSSDDQDAGVREVASARYRQLLAGGCEASDLDARLAELDGCSDEIVLGYVARRGRETELRLAALERLQSASIFEEVAIHDLAPRVRQAAVARLTVADSLERVMRQARERDRRVARMARDKLQQLQQQQEAEVQAQTERELICADLERLVFSGQQDEAERQRLLNRWQAIDIQPQSDIRNRFEAALTQYQSMPAKPAALAPDFQALLDELRQASQPEQSRLERVRDALTEASESLLQASQQEVGQLRAYLESASRYLEHETGLAAAVKALQELEPERTIGMLQKQIETVAWHADFPKPELLQQAEARLQEAMQQGEHVTAQRKQQRNELEKQLTALADSLAKGRLKESQRLLAQAQKIEKQLPPADRERFERQLRRKVAKVRELQDWRRFATLPKQEELCLQMEELVDADLPPAELMTRIQRLQEEWKATGGSASPEGQQLWERFHTAGNHAFDRCREYLDQQAELRQLNLQKRQAIAEQLKGFVDAADWAALELAGLEAIRAQARQEWQQAAPVDRRALRSIEAGFESLMKTLTGHIREKQRQHRQLKEDLIASARELLQVDDIRAASEQAKQLQAQWKKIGPASANVDRRLWREFREACDAIFQRRDAVRGEADQERQERLGQAQEICEEVEALVADTAMSLDRIEARLQTLRETYRRLRPLPREGAQLLTKRLNAAERALSERRDQERRLREESVAAAIQGRVQLCANLEQAALQNDVIDNAAWETRWQGLDKAPSSLQPALEARWQRGLAAADGRQPYDQQELAANLEKQLELCVRMEILAGIESSPEEQSYRMNLQVKRLNDGLAAGMQQSRPEQAREIEREWLCLGPALPADQAEALAARFETARDMLARLE